MADWKQISARIRRARGSKDPAGQLTVLFEKTKDGMVAFELARHFEIVRDPSQALTWYETAFSRFRRGDWKTKSSEAILRLGGTLPEESPAKLASEATASSREEQTDPATEQAMASEADSASADSVVSSPSPADTGSPAALKRRRRGRRGGRNRNKKVAAAAAQPPAPVDSAVHSPRESAREADAIAPPRAVDARAIPRVPVEEADASTAPSVKGRFGDPGLSSRLTRLEMQLRRLLTCPPAKLGHTEGAPAGPGVFVLTDDDMTTYYHVEACDTLRIAIGNLARSGAARRGNIDLKPLLADHLGIPEARVSKYLADHCVVRWLQLDEGAVPFAHFAIAVLRPILND